MLTLTLSLAQVRALVDACRSPAVRAAVRKAVKPVLVAAAAQWVALFVLLLPLNVALRVLSVFLPFGPISSRRVASASLAVYPLVCALLAKFVYRARLAECFLQSLREVDPRMAAALASGKPAHARGARGEAAAAPYSYWAGRDGDNGDGGGDDARQMALLVAVSGLLRVWRNTGALAAVLAPVAEFLSMRFMIGGSSPWVAAALTAVATLCRPAAPYVMGAAEVWAGARALGASSLRFFTQRAIPRGRQAAFVRTFEPTVCAYFLWPTLLMRLPAGPLAPFLPPLLVWPCAAVGARCLHDIATQRRSERAFNALRAGGGGDDGGGADVTLKRL